MRPILCQVGQRVLTEHGSLRIRSTSKRRPRTFSSQGNNNLPSADYFLPILTGLADGFTKTEGRHGTTMKPIIGITPSAQLDTLAHGTFLRYCMSAPYVRAVETAGGVPIVLPPQRDSIDELISLIDGLLLSGGPDVDPARCACAPPPLNQTW